MNKLFLIMPAIAMSMSVTAQTIDFESHTGYKSVGVYDTWQESPFRTGELKGNARIVDNFLKDGNASSKILGIQRSRFGSNTFGVRINLTAPFNISPDTLYVHVLMHRPVAGKVMLIGLGRRGERTGQSPETEQFWVYSENEILPGKWNDAVFAVRGNKGVEIHSLVVVPDCSSPHNMKADFAAYIDDIEITDDASPRIRFKDSSSSLTSLTDNANITLNATGRNGHITDCEGRELLSIILPRNKAYEIKAVPAPGFTLDCVIIKSNTLEKKVEASDFTGEMTFKIPSEWMKDDIIIEGFFKSTDSR